MNHENKVVWSEGILLQPQHFQQQDRHVESWIENRCAPLHPFSFGFTQLDLDEDLLSQGYFSIKSCSGIFPDGTPFNVPDGCDPPEPIKIALDTTDQIIRLGIAARRAMTLEMSEENNTTILSRHKINQQKIKNYLLDDNEPVDVAVGSIRLQLLTGEQSATHFSRLSVAKVKEYNSEQGIVLDPTFLPTCLTVSADPVIGEFMSKVVSVLKQRSEILAASVTVQGDQISDLRHFLVLQIVNRYFPLFQHYQKTPTTHPESIYQTTVQLVSELATYSTQNKRVEQLPSYSHEQPGHALLHLQNLLESYCTEIITPNLIEISFQPRRQGFFKLTLSDESVVENMTYILEVDDEVDPTEFCAQVTIGERDEILDLLRIPNIGVPISPCTTNLPRAIEPKIRATYFLLHTDNSHWAQILETRVIALKIAGIEEFTHLSLKLYIVPNKV